MLPSGSNSGNANDLGNAPVDVNRIIELLLAQKQSQPRNVNVDQYFQHALLQNAQSISQYEQLRQIQSVLQQQQQQVAQAQAQAQLQAQQEHSKSLIRSSAFQSQMQSPALIRNSQQQVQPTQQQQVDRNAALMLLQQHQSFANQPGFEQLRALVAQQYMQSQVQAQQQSQPQQPPVVVSSGAPISAIANAPPSSHQLLVDTAPSNNNGLNVSPAVHQHPQMTEEQKEYHAEKTALTSRREECENEKKKCDLLIDQLQRRYETCRARIEEPFSDDDIEEETELLELPLYKKIHLENAKRLAEARAKLPKFLSMDEIDDPPSDHSPQDSPEMRDLIERNKEFQPKLIAMLREKKIKEQRAETAFELEHHEKWKKWRAKVQKEQNQPKRIEEKNNRRAIFEETFPELKKAREDKGRVDRAHVRVENAAPEDDQAKTEAEEMLKMRKAAAIVPFFLVDRKHDAFFDNKSLIVPDMAKTHNEYLDAQLASWNDEEKEVFRNRIQVVGKNFANIAEYLPKKSVKDTVLFYYLTKKVQDYKSILPKKKRKQQKSYKAPPMPTSEEISLYAQTEGSRSDPSFPIVPEIRCAVCAQLVDPATNPSRLMTRASFENFGFHCPSKKRDIQVCAKCQETQMSKKYGKSFGGKCLVKACIESTRKMKATKPMPQKWRQLNRQQKSFIAHDISMPVDATKTCANCSKRVQKRIEQLLNGELDEEFTQFSLESMQLWEDREVARLFELVDEFGRDWEQIAEQMDSRTADECRMQFENLKKEEEPYEDNDENKLEPERLDDETVVDEETQDIPETEISVMRITESTIPTVVKEKTPSPAGEPVTVKEEHLAMEPQKDIFQVEPQKLGSITAGTPVRPPSVSIIEPPAVTSTSTFLGVQQPKQSASACATPQANATELHEFMNSNAEHMVALRQEIARMSNLTKSENKEEIQRRMLEKFQAGLIGVAKGTGHQAAMGEVQPSPVASASLQQRMMISQQQQNAEQINAQITNFANQFSEADLRQAVERTAGSDMGRLFKAALDKKLEQLQQQQALVAKAIQQQQQQQQLLRLQPFMQQQQAAVAMGVDTAQYLAYLQRFSQTQTQGQLGDSSQTQTQPDLAAVYQAILQAQSPYVNAQAQQQQLSKLSAEHSEIVAQLEHIEKSIPDLQKRIQELEDEEKALTQRVAQDNKVLLEAQSHKAMLEQQRNLFLSQQAPYAALGIAQNFGATEQAIYIQLQHSINIRTNQINHFTQQCTDAKSQLLVKKHHRDTAVRQLQESNKKKEELGRKEQNLRQQIIIYENIAKQTISSTTIYNNPVTTAQAQFSMPTSQMMQQHKVYGMRQAQPQDHPQYHKPAISSAPHSLAPSRSNTNEFKADPKRMVNSTIERASPAHLNHPHEMNQMKRKSGLETIIMPNVPTVPPPSSNRLLAGLSQLRRPMSPSQNRAPSARTITGTPISSTASLSSERNSSTPTPSIMVAPPSSTPKSAMALSHIPAQSQQQQLQQQPDLSSTQQQQQMPSCDFVRGLAFPKKVEQGQQVTSTAVITGTGSTLTSQGTPSSKMNPIAIATTAANAVSSPASMFQVGNFPVQSNFSSPGGSSVSQSIISPSARSAVGIATSASTPVITIGECESTITATPASTVTPLSVRNGVPSPMLYSSISDSMDKMDSALITPLLKSPKFFFEPLSPEDEFRKSPPYLEKLSTTGCNGQIYLTFDLEILPPQSSEDFTGVTPVSPSGMVISQPIFEDLSDDEMN